MLFQVCSDQEYQRKLHPDDLPLRMQQQCRDIKCHFIVRKNPRYQQKRQVVLSILDNTTTDDIDSKIQRNITSAMLHRNCVRELKLAPSLDARQSCNNDITKKKSNNFFTSPYSPVYNVREISTVSNTFSSASIECDKKISQHCIPFTSKKRHSVANVANSSMKIVHEAINNNSNYVYV